MPRHTETPDEVRERLDAGQDLSPGQVAILLGNVTRFAVDRWLVDGIQVDGGERWIPEHTFTPGRHRKIPASTVRRILELAAERRPRSPRASRARRRPEASDGPSPTG